MADSPSTDMSLERLKLWIGLGKFFIGTVALGAVTLFLNHQIQRAQIKLEEDKSQHAMALQDKETEFEYLGKFMTHAMNEDLNIRIQLADYMKSAALSDNIRGIWSRYHDILVVERDQGEARRRDLEKAEKAKAKELTQLSLAGEVDDTARARAVAAEIQDIRTELAVVQDQLDRQRYGTYDDNFFDFDTLLDQADIAEAAGRYDQQRDLLLEAMDGAPESIHHYILWQLAQASRSLHDFSKGREYMERAVALGPPSAGALYALAVMQKNDGRLDLAVETLAEAETIASDDEWLEIQVVRAGYLIHMGRADEGRDLFESIRDAVEGNDDYAGLTAWFYAVADRKDDFYRAFERALQLRPVETLIWVDQEVDIAALRNESKFKALVAQYDPR